MQHHTRPIRTSAHRAGTRTRAVATRAGLAAMVVLAAGVAAPTGAAGAEDPGIDCAEWDASAFDASAERLDARTVQVGLTYADPGEPLPVCPFSIVVSLRDAADLEVGSTWTSADVVESATASSAGSLAVLVPHRGCGWQVRLGVEESLPIVLDDTEPCLVELPLRVELPRLPAPLPDWWGSVARWLR